METATDPIWVALVSIVKLVAPPIALEYIAVILGIAFMVGALVIAQYTGFVMWERTNNVVLVPFGLVVVAGIAAYWDFTTGGLDTALVLLWLSSSFGLTAVLLARGLDGRKLWAGGVVIGLGFLVRPDLAPYAIAFLILGVWAQYRHGWQQMLAWVSAVGALPFAYMIFRMGYFGAMVPAPAISKGASRSDWGTGFAFLVDTITTYRLAVPAGALVVAGYWLLTRDQGWLATHQLRVLTMALYAAAAVQVTFIIRLGGGFMHARLLLPALFALVLPFAVLPLRRSFVMIPWVVVIVWALVSAVALRPAEVSGYIADERAYYVNISGVDHPVVLPGDPTQLWAAAGIHHGRLPGSPSDPLLTLPDSAEYLNFIDGPVYQAKPAIPGARVYSPQSSIGMYAFAGPLDLHIVDRFGLADPIASRLTLEKPQRPGHSKVLPLEWVVARFAGEAVDLEYLDPEKVRSASQALTCGSIAELIAAKTDPLTFSRFWANLVGAPSRTLLRIAPNPLEAVVQHCPGQALGDPMPRIRPTEFPPEE